MHIPRLRHVVMNSYLIIKCIMHTTKQILTKLLRHTAFHVKRTIERNSYAYHIKNSNEFSNEIAIHYPNEHRNAYPQNSYPNAE